MGRFTIDDVETDWVKEEIEEICSVCGDTLDEQGCCPTCDFEEDCDTDESEEDKLFDELREDEEEVEVEIVEDDN